MPAKLPVLLLALAALFAIAAPAQALTPAPAVTSTVVPFDEAEFEGEAEASEDEELEVEECELNDEGECEEEDSAGVPEECLLSSAEATIFALGNSDKVRLQLRYTATSPTAVAVAYGLHGNKGSLFLGDEKQQFGRKGVLRLNRSLTETQMAKVMAAKDFTVRIRALKAPGYCGPYFDRHLTVRRATPSGLSWLQSE
ncbi:MAG TPA: hypothetical protein VFI03_11135 [Solirubrobacterales bacterium]|nr:hypothetical protein [Solirubrobacterales bacterium]